MSTPLVKKKNGCVWHLGLPKPYTQTSPRPSRSFFQNVRVWDLLQFCVGPAGLVLWIPKVEKWKHINMLGEIVGLCSPNGCFTISYIYIYIYFIYTYQNGWLGSSMYSHFSKSPCVRAHHVENDSRFDLNVGKPQWMGLLRSLTSGILVVETRPKHIKYVHFDWSVNRHHPLR